MRIQIYITSSAYSRLLTLDSGREDLGPPAEVDGLQRDRDRVTGGRVERAPENGIDLHVLPLCAAQHKGLAGERGPADGAGVEAIAAVVGDDGAAGRVVEWVPDRRRVSSIVL